MAYRDPHRAPPPPPVQPPRPPDHDPVRFALGATLALVGIAMLLLLAFVAARLIG
ncbi:MAG: hypothetical protein N2688_10420 [Burkholderiaceae bacterium]|nr:hypothetical protein [Burkholderiaceae bacterium]